jgi:hypothetical protein
MITTPGTAADAIDGAADRGNTAVTNCSEHCGVVELPERCASLTLTANSAPDHQWVVGMSCVGLELRKSRLRTDNGKHPRQGDRGNRGSPPHHTSDFYGARCIPRAGIT